jgi:hypothetical protein
MKQERNLGRINYVANQLVPFDMPEVSLYHKIQLRLRGDITIAGGTTSGTPVEYNPVSIITNIDLVGDGQVNIFQASAVDTYTENLIDNQLPGELVPLVNGDAQANTIVFGTIDMNFEYKRKPGLELVTLLDSRRYENLYLNIQFGNDAQLIAGGDRTVTINSLYIDVILVEETEFIINPRFIRKRAYLQDNNLVLSDVNDQDLSRGNPYNRILVSVQNNGLYSNTLINNIKIILNDKLFPIDAPFNALRNTMNQLYRLDQAQSPVGFCMITFDFDQDLTNLLLSRDLNTFKARFDSNAPTGVSFARIMTDELIPLDITT